MNAETPMREGREDDVEADGEGELQARQQQGVSFHLGILHPLRGRRRPLLRGIRPAGGRRKLLFRWPDRQPPGRNFRGP